MPAMEARRTWMHHFNLGLNLHLRKASNLDGLQVGRTGEVESCTARFGYGCGGEHRIGSLENFENLKKGQL